MTVARNQNNVAVCMYKSFHRPLIYRCYRTATQNLADNPVAKYLPWTFWNLDVQLSFRLDQRFKNNPNSQNVMLLPEIHEIGNTMSI
jgi:hypothetical protein